jgi:hypothetical protein
VAKRLKYDPSRGPGLLPPGLEDPKMADLLQEQLARADSFLAFMQEKDVEALRQVREYQPQAHHENIDARAKPALTAHGCLGGAAVLLPR